MSGGPAGSRSMNVALWMAQVLVALAFGMAGTLKTITPIEELVKKMPWFVAVPWLPRIIGPLEIAGALGMLLPSITRVRPTLTPLAGVGLSTVMVLAAGMHALRGELQMVPVNILLGALASFVAWGRFKKAPIEPRRSSTSGRARSGA